MTKQSQLKHPKKFTMTKPSVYRGMQTVGKPDESHNELYREDIEKLLDDPTFDCIIPDDYECITVQFRHVMETDEQWKLRVEREEAALAEYHRLKAESEAEHEAWKQHQKELKKINDQKYKDPEYIEFLRMKAKLESKGIEV